MGPLLHLLLKIGEDRWQGPDDEGKSDEDQGDRDARGGVDDVDAVGLKPAAQPASGRVQRPPAVAASQWPPPVTSRRHRRSA